MIARVEFRGEDDPEVARYTHKRTLDVLTVSPNRHLAECYEHLHQVLRQVLRPLIDARVSLPRSQRTRSIDRGGPFFGAVSSWRPASQHLTCGPSWQRAAWSRVASGLSWTAVSVCPLVVRYFALAAGST